MSAKVHKLKVIIPVKDKNEVKETRMASLSAVFGPKGIKALDIIKKFDSETAELGYAPNTPLIVKVNIQISRTGKTENYKMFIQTPSISFITKELLKVEKFSKKPGKEILKTVSTDIVEKIYNIKYHKCDGLLKSGRIKSIVGTLKSMGIIIKE